VAAVRRRAGAQVVADAVAVDRLADEHVAGPEVLGRGTVRHRHAHAGERVARLGDVRVEHRRERVALLERDVDR
jgi:hypothetical protein